MKFPFARTVLSHLMIHVSRVCGTLNHLKSFYDKAMINHREKIVETPQDVLIFVDVHRKKICWAKLVL